MAETHRESERKGVANFKAGHEEETAQLVVTINPAMGGIIKVEKIDKGGNHQELSEDEAARLVGGDEVEEIESALDEAFEVAVASVIGEDYEGGEYDDDEEKAIRRFLISDLLIPRAARRRILHRLLLNQMLRRRFRKRRLHQFTEDRR
jgi:hypothetical protein